ncbi:MAG: cytochrome c3 family protein [Elusimicrobia bacterium]|nr:cytochrome c3 family protein [Elusimicrobiota bacterium]
MKKHESVWAGMLIACALVLPARPARAVVAGSLHDFTAAPYSLLTTCSGCHVPHQTKTNVPLWAHATSTYTYTLYNQNAAYVVKSPAFTYDASPSALTGSKSLLCLGCHDGTVAVSGTNYITQASASWILYDAGAKVGGQASANPSAGLKGSHPIGVVYQAVAGKYNDISLDPDVKLDSTKVQCTSCHNPHNLFPKMLVKSGAALCTTCHIK